MTDLFLTVLFSAFELLHRPEPGLNTINRLGRAAQGVTVMNLKVGDTVAGVALLNGDDEGDDAGEDAVSGPRSKG